MGDNQMAHKTEIENIQSLETTRRQLRCESSKKITENYKRESTFRRWARPKMRLMDDSKRAL